MWLAGKSDKADVIILLLEKGANTGGLSPTGRLGHYLPAMVLDKNIRDDCSATLRDVRRNVVALISESAEEAQ